MSRAFDAIEAELNPKSIVPKLDQKVRHDELGRTIYGIRDQIKPAIYQIVLGALSVGLFLLGWRLAFFYVLAPKVSRLPGLRPVHYVGGKVSAQAVVTSRPQDPGLISTASVSLQLHPHETLYVRHRFLQSRSNAFDMGTQWIFDWRMPLSSIAAHLLVLTRIRALETPRDLVLASTGADAMGELSVLTVPEGSALVIRPRNLVGIIRSSDQRVRITREWKLNQPIA